MDGEEKKSIQKKCNFLYELCRNVDFAYCNDFYTHVLCITNNIYLCVRCLRSFTFRFVCIAMAKSCTWTNLEFFVCIFITIICSAGIMNTEYCEICCLRLCCSPDDEHFGICHLAFMLLLMRIKRRLSRYMFTDRFIIYLILFTYTMHTQIFSHANIFIHY